MQPDLATALADHAAATDGWRALARELAAEQANWRPASQRWSIAQCLDHVRIVTEAVLPGLEAAVADARARGATAPGPYRYGWLGRWFLAVQAPGRGRGARTPGVYSPSTTAVDAAVAWARFEAVQARFGAVIEAADGVDLARVRVASPALALLQLPVGIWLQALPQHTLRHLVQARRVRDEPRFPEA